MQHKLLRLLSLGTLLTGCSDSHSPDDRLHGEYIATSFLTTSGGNTTDMLENGGLLYLDFDKDGRLTGSFSVGKDTLDVEGAYIESKDTVRIKTAPATLLEQLEYVRTGEDLVVNMQLQLIRFQITLEPMTEVLRSER